MVTIYSLSTVCLRNLLGNLARSGDLGYGLPSFNFEPVQLLPFKVSDTNLGSADFCMLFSFQAIARSLLVAGGLLPEQNIDLLQGQAACLEGWSAFANQHIVCLQSLTSGSLNQK
jgi:hypothetical protein